jgi:hypothetical protein
MDPNGQPPSPSGDDPADATNRVDSDPTDGVWMTKAQLAAVRRISVASADRLIRRQGWRKHPGNDGRARVLVPPDWAASRLSGPTDAPRANPTDYQPERPSVAVADPTDRAADPTDITHAISALEAAVSTLNEQLAATLSRADQAEADRRQAEAARDAAIALADQTVALLKDAVAHADRAEQGRDGERARADALRDQVTSLQAQLATAEAEAKAVNDRAWATGEQLGAAEQRAETERERADRLASSVAHERQDFLDAESRTRRELDDVRGQVEALRVQLGARQEVVDAAEAIRQADDSRRALSRWARLRRAWRGG